MKCFNHHTDDAVAICKSCGKALCPQCAASLPNGIACKNNCEDRVNMLNLMIDNNNKVIATTNTNLKSYAVFSIILGALFISMGGLFYRTDVYFSAIIVTIGIAFLINGIRRNHRKSLFPTMNSETKDTKQVNNE